MTRVYRQRRGEITPEECLKEGGYTPEEFRNVWRRINGGWDPDEVVAVYEFKLHDKPQPRSLNG